MLKYHELFYLMLTRIGLKVRLVQLRIKKLDSNYLTSKLSNRQTFHSFRHGSILREEANESIMNLDSRLR